MNYSVVIEVLVLVFLLNKFVQLKDKDVVIPPSLSFQFVLSITTLSMLCLSMSALNYFWIIPIVFAVSIILLGFKGYQVLLLESCLYLRKFGKKSP